MLEAAQGSLLSLVCIENSRHNKFCFYFPIAWPEITETPLDTRSDEISDGMYAFWFNSEDEL